MTKKAADGQGKTNPADAKPLLALTGQYQNGKSTLLNCLLGGFYAVEGGGTVTTKYNAKYRFGDFFDAKLVANNGTISSLPPAGDMMSVDDTIRQHDDLSRLEISVYSPLLKMMDLLDSPGCGANPEDNRTADAALDQADFIIFVTQKTLDNESDLDFLSSLSEKGKHFTVVLNCFGAQDPLSEQAQSVCQEIKAQLDGRHLDRNYVPLSENAPVYPVNLLWAQCAIGYLEPGERKQRREQVKRMMEQDDFTPSSLFFASNFAPLRTLLSSFVKTFFSYTPAKSLSLFPEIANQWSDLLIKTIRG